MLWPLVVSTFQDFTDEKVLESLRLLTDKLVQAQERSEQVSTGHHPDDELSHSCDTTFWTDCVRAQS